MPTQTPQAGSNQTAVKATDGTALNPLAVNIAKAIRQQESQGDYNAVGDNGQSHGAYQFNKGNFGNWAKQYGLDPDDMSPTNQDKVAYKRINDLLQQGKAPSEVAAIWNGAKVENGKYVPINPAYVEGVKNNYEKITGGTQTPQVASSQGIQPPIPAGQSQSSNIASGGYEPPAPPSSGVNTAEASTGNAAPQSTLQKIGSAAGTVGNFLFPAAKDFYNDVTGQNTGENHKTFLQQAGDTALSVLPFIPGLGEAGEAARGADVVGSILAKNAAGEILPDAAAKLAAATPSGSSGLLSKLAGSTVAKNAAIGYGGGVASNLSQGEDIGQSLTPGINNVGGAVLGAGGSLLGKALGGILDSAAGIPGNVKPVLSKLSKPGLYDEYTNVAEKRAADIRNPSVLERAADYTEKAVGQMKKNLTNVGQTVSDLKNQEGTRPIKSVIPVLQKFAQDVEDKFGIKIYASPTGKNITIQKAPGRAKDILSASDQTRIKTALRQVLSLRNGGNVRKASDIIDNLDSLVDYSKKDLLGNSNDPLESFLKSTRHNLNGVISESSPQLAAAKTRYHGLSNALESIKGAGGANLQRAELLLKRVFSGDQSQTSRDIFDIIKKETGIDLTEHAVLAKHFVDNMGDQSEKSALQKMLEANISKGSPTIPGLLMQGGKAALNATIANPIKQGRRIVEGKPGILGPILRNSKGVLTKGLLTAGRAVLGQ